MVGGVVWCGGAWMGGSGHGGDGSRSRGWSCGSAQQGGDRGQSRPVRDDRAARRPHAGAHHHESWDETVYGLAGVTTWRVDGSDVAVGPGETLFIRRGVVHAFRNDGPEPAICLCILTPGVLGPGYFRELAALAAAGAPDPAKVKEIMLLHGLVPAAGP